MALASNLGARPYNQRYSAHSCLCSCYTWSSPWRTCQISVISQFRAKFLTISSLRCGHNSSVNNGEGFPWSQFCRWTSLYRRTWIIVVHQCSSMFLNVPQCSSMFLSVRLYLTAVWSLQLTSSRRLLISTTASLKFKGALNLPSSLTATWAVPEPFPESTPSFSDRMVIPTAVHGVKQSLVFVHPSLIRWSSRVNSDHADGSGTQRLARELIRFVVSESNIVYTSDYLQNSIVLILYGYSGINYCLNIDFQPIDKHSLGVSLKNRQILLVDAWCMVWLSCHN